MSESLLVTHDGPVCRITLNRPERRNALLPELIRDVGEAVDRAGAVEGTRVVVLRGAGGHFCVGLDLHWLPNLGHSPSMATMQRLLHDFQSAILAIVRSPLPVIAVLEGSAAGFGLDLALACDLRLASDTATCTSAFAKMGLVPDGGSSLTLPALIGRGRALRFLLAGETLRAADAERLGMLDEVVPAAELEARIEALVHGMLGGAEQSVMTIKRLVRGDEIGALEQALAAEGAAQIQALQAPEFARRAAAFAARKGGGGA